MKRQHFSIGNSLWFWRLLYGVPGALLVLSGGGLLSIAAGLFLIGMAFSVGS